MPKGSLIISKALISLQGIAFIFRPRLGLILGQILGISSLAYAQSNSGASELVGSIKIMSNYVDHGITQSNKGPSLLLQTGYEIGAGRIGVRAANVKYEDESVSIEGAVYGDYKFVFTSNTDLTVKNDLIRYYSDATRSKIKVELDLNLFSYHVRFMREDNFEGTKKVRDWYGFGKDWVLSQSFKLNTTVGYSMVENYDNFFDTYVGITYFAAKLSGTIANTYINKSSQFNGHGNPATFLILDIKF